MEKVKNIPAGILAWFKNWDKVKSVLCIALAMILIGGLVASMIQTDFFRVKIYTKSLETTPTLETSTSKAFQAYQERGAVAVSVADIYMPKAASADNKVPLILVMPGIQRTKETQASFCIELVRRGFGVICMDPFGQGESSPSYESQSATKEGYGLFYWMDYLFTEEGKAEFDWVDYSRIGATGHSAGGNGVQKLAEREGKLANDTKSASRLNAAYITGYIRDWSWSNTACNVGISYSSNDEGAFQNDTALKKAEIQAKLDAGQSITEEEQFWLTVANGDMRYAPEAVDIVNFQLNRAGMEKITEVEVGADYGNPYEGTYAVINNEACLHPMQPYDNETLTNLVRFFGYCFDNYDASNLQQGLKDTNHSWLWKEIGSGLALVGGFAFMLALLCLLLRTRLFASLQKEPMARTGNQKIKGRIIFWATFAISAVIACVLYMVCVQLSVDWFPDAKSGNQTWFFPQRFTNAVMIWAVANGLIGIAIFFATWGLEYVIDYFRAKKTQTVADVHLAYRSKLDPMKVQGSDWWKTPLLALILILAFFGANWLCYLIFHVDMRFFFISARVMGNWNSILAGLMYVPFFLIFYLSNSLRVNCGMRPSNWPEWLSKIIAVLGNTLGLVAIMVIEYAPFISSGTIGYTDTEAPQWLFVNMLFSIIPMMFALPLFNRFFFNRTRRAWLGGIVICVIFILMTTSGTTIYYLNR